MRGLFLFLLFPLCLTGQNNLVYLEVFPAEKGSMLEQLRTFKTATAQITESGIAFQLKPPVNADSLCRALLRHFRERAYLAVSIDSLHMRPDSSWSAKWFSGPLMRWLKLRPADEISAAWMSTAGYRGNPFDGLELRHAELLDLQKNILQAAENNGYPFASVALDSVLVDEKGAVVALLRVDQNRYFTIKALKNNGDVKLPAYFLPNYLGLRAGNPYNRARILRLREQLNTLLFAESTANPSVTFSGNEATVNLFLQKKRAGRFDLILGILPQPENEGKVLINGSLSAAFQNALNLGERFSIEMERLRPETQKLDVRGAVPYLFGTVFGVDGRLNIFKRDSTWVDAQTELGVQYLLQEGNFFRFFWENRTNTLQKIDTAQLIAARRLPATLDLSQNGFGLETFLANLDYPFNPRKGWMVNLKGSAGFNRVLKNNQIESLTDPANPDFTFASLYDSIELRSSRFKLETRTEWYLPVFSRSVLKLSLRAGGIFSNQPLYANEQYRLGGNKLLRGFNEESLQASRFAVATVEWRLLIGRNSFIGAFADWGYVENITANTRVFLRPAGLGAGLNFETPAGIFGVNMAVGRPDTGLGFDFRAVKFHLGFVSLQI
ncbi:MAG: BamA/TamA family outer membrane protein [Saprospiraceae bacterium]|nr:BamA/TamA family outer membrane protein [Saprospiraceae bacterium]